MRTTNAKPKLTSSIRGEWIGASLKNIQLVSMIRANLCSFWRHISLRIAFTWKYEPALSGETARVKHEIARVASIVCRLMFKAILHY